MSQNGQKGNPLLTHFLGFIEDWVHWEKSVFNMGFSDAREDLSRLAIPSNNLITLG